MSVYKPLRETDVYNADVYADRILKESVCLKKDVVSAVKLMQNSLYKAGIKAGDKRLDDVIRMWELQKLIEHCFQLEEVKS